MKSTSHAERLAEAVHIIKKIDDEHERTRLIVQLDQDGDFTAAELLAELSKSARSRMEMEAEMPMPELSPPLDAPH